MDIEQLIGNVANNRFILFVWWISILLLLGILAGRIVAKIQKTIIKVVEQSPEETKRTVTLAQAASWVVQASVWIVVFVLVGNRLGIPPQVLTLFSTVFGAGLGFGMQSLFKDIISSVVNIGERLMNVGDFVELDVSGTKYSGTITRMTLRHIQLSSETGGTIVVPQGVITVVRNYSEGVGRFVLDLFFDTGSNMEIILPKIESLLHRINQDEDLSDVGDAQDLADIQPVYEVELRGVSDVSQGKITVQIVGSTSPGDQFAAKRAILKMATTMLHNDDIFFHNSNKTILVEPDTEQEV